MDLRFILWKIWKHINRNWRQEIHYSRKYEHCRRMTKIAQRFFWLKNRRRRLKRAIQVNGNCNTSLMSQKVANIRADGFVWFIVGILILLARKYKSHRYSKRKNSNVWNRYMRRLAISNFNQEESMTAVSQGNLFLLALIKRRVVSFRTWLA